ncbi:hypothetical protein PFLUV_G00160690 [Perca fluviatilis]|uniref:Uncharacterized protein n=1 Tax=Perca fluviatilis TaxID=8168 RepID=A0A6A5E0U8_PERFL|nr:hypothetical protein PFLUV_G00160690 [Perca fluviatilis]
MLRRSGIPEVPEASEGIIGVAIGAVLGILLTVGVEAAVLFVLYKKGIIGLCSSSKSSLICRYNGSNSGPAVYLPPPQDSDESSTDSDRSRDEPPKLSHQALRRMKKMNRAKPILSILRGDTSDPS